MTRDDIIRMAQEAGIGVKDDSLVPVWHLSIKHLERFAALVRADERIRFADKCIDIVAFNGGSVEIEADIRSLAET